MAWFSLKNVNKFLLVGYSISNKHDSLITIGANCGISIRLHKQLKSHSESRGEISNFFSINLSHSFLELSDVFIGSLDKFSSAILSGETWDQWGWSFAEFVNCDKIIFTEGLQNVKDHMFGWNNSNWFWKIRLFIVWKFMVFQSLRFYVKSILGVITVQNLPFKYI